MNNFGKIAFLALASTLVVGQPVSAADRTIIERLESHTPEQAAKVFVGAFMAEDYVAAYFLLSPHARRGFSEAIQSFSLDTLFVGLDNGGQVPGSVLAEGASFSDDDNYAVLTEPVLNFDNLVFAASQGGFLPIRLITPQLGAPTMSSEGLLIISVTNDGEPKALSLELVPTARGTWLVDRISWAGSAPDMRPWGVAQ